MKNSKEIQPDPRHPDKAQAAERLLRSESARAERAEKKRLKALEEEKAIREGKKRMIHGVHANPPHPRPIPEESEHIDVEWDGSLGEELLNQQAEGDVNVAWKDAPTERVTVWESPQEGHTDIFAAAGIDANPQEGIHPYTFEGHAELDDDLMSPRDRVTEIEETEMAEADYAGTREQFE